MTPTIFSHPARQPAKFRPFKALSHFRKLIKDKEDTEQVFHIFENLPRKGFMDDARAFVESDFGQRLMASEPYLPDLLDDHGWIDALPEGTVGHAYVTFMRREGLSAAGLVAEADKMGRPKFDDQVQWYANRLRDTHDLFHILTGYGRDALGEQCVLGFTYGQTGNYGNFFIAYAGGYEVKRSIKSDAPVMGAIRQGQRHGKASKAIIEQDIRSLLAEPLDAARARLGIGEPTLNKEAHRAYRSRGIDPYNVLASQQAVAAGTDDPPLGDAMGRGTARVASGGGVLPLGTEPHDAVCDSDGVGEDVLRGDTQHPHSLRFNPLVARLIAVGPVAHVVGDAVDLDRELGGGAVEVEHVAADRMLAAEAHTARAAAQALPE